MLIDAIVLAGGHSSRLGGSPKARLLVQNQTLLERSVEAVAFARSVAAVGDVAGISPAGCLTAREEPVFGGPAAGIAAGLVRLRGAHFQPSDFTVVLACDMPHSAAAVAVLRESLLTAKRIDGDGLICVDDDGHPQPLAAVYRTHSLFSAITDHGQLGQLHGLSVFRLIANLTLTEIAVPPGSTDDVDTWDDAARFGIAHPRIMEEP